MSTKTAEKPVMAAKKEFVLPPSVTVDEVPASVRANTQVRLPLGFDALYEKVKKSKKSEMQPIPNALWESRGIAAEKIVPANVKDRCRRAFYGWQGKDEEKAKYTLSFSDQVEKGKFTGVNMYFSRKPAA